MSGLIRQLKLHALVGAKVTTDPRIPAIVDFFDGLLKGMQMTIIPEFHPRDIIFHKDHTCHMAYIYEDNFLRCRYDDYWDYLEKTIGIVGYTEKQAIIKHMVEKELQLDLGIPMAGLNGRDNYINNQLERQRIRDLLRREGIPHAGFLWDRGSPDSFLKHYNYVI